jgi:phospholipid/cholesterol/gamma-HCH transport system ATP-binding protein
MRFRPLLLNAIVLASLIKLKNPHMKNLVEIRDLHFARGERAIFDGVDIDIAQGKVTAIMGPSGCGKTTLLRIIGGQVKPDKGTVKFDGQNVPSLRRKDLFELRKRMGLLFQSGALFTDLTVFENVAFPLRAHTRLSEELIRDLVIMKLEAVGLRGARHLMPSELSGGMNRRAALARTIALDPEMIMFDEPFAGQDPISMGVLVKLIRALNQALGITTIIVSHDVHETATIADYIYVFAKGKIIGHGTPQEVLNHSSPEVQQFMKGLPDGPVAFHYPAASYAADLLEGVEG